MQEAGPGIVSYDDRIKLINDGAEGLDGMYETMKNMIALLVVPFLFSCGDGGIDPNQGGASEKQAMKAEIAKLKERVKKLEDRESLNTRSAPNNSQIEPKPSGRSWARLSPFTEVSCDEDKALVTFSGKRYELVSIDGFTTKQILYFCRKAFAARWEKRFAEDLVEVMSGMGKQAGITVNLVLKELDTNNVITVPDAPMTADNRRAVWKNRQ